MLPLVVPLVAAIVTMWPRAAWLHRFAGILSSAAILATGVVLIVGRRIEGTAGAVQTAADGLLRVDALSAYMLAVIGAVGLVATWGGLARRPAGTGAGGSLTEGAGRYAALICVFLAAMSLAVEADNLGIVWVAVEATTITTAFLVGHHRTRHSLEAAWKYVILGSVGIAIAFLGIVLIYASTSGMAAPTLSWVQLSQAHAHVDPNLIRLGAALAVLGFATKAGLAPMHSWLPDAHSQAPAPVSALMSGVLLSVALYAILRIQAIAAPVIGSGFLTALLVVGGLLSLAVSAALLIRQRDYKRMLAYSSIEHMGVMALGAAVGPSALPAVLLYVLSHGLIKACLFVLSGRIFAVRGTTAVTGVRGLLTARPRLAALWLAGIAALLGFPPFGIFFAELGIVLAGWNAGMAAVMVIALALMLLIFAAFARTTIGMMFGPAGSEGPTEAPQASSSASAPPLGPRLPLILALAACAILPFVAGPVGTALAEAAAALGETR